MNTNYWPPVLKPMSLALACMILFPACGGMRIAEDESKEPIGVMIVGVHHLGPNFNISKFYIDGHYSLNVGREGGGGSFVCCVELPLIWQPGMTAKVRWSVNDWSNAVMSEVDAGNYKSMGFENYEAVVPIEKYGEVGNLYAHFFSNGRVRLVSSAFSVGNAQHAIQQNDPRAAEIATRGTKILKR